MASSGSGYDLSPTTFSPDGRIFQVEYASKSVASSGTLIGLKCSDGIVLACEKLLANKMLVPGSNRRINTVSKNAGCAFTGFVSDGRQIVNRSREESSSYLDTYGIPIPPAVLADRLAHYVHYFTMHGALRPFGASMVLGCYEEDMDELGLYMVEPSGQVFKYYGCAAGKGRQGAKTEIEKLDLSTLTVAQGIKEAARIITMLRDDGKDKPMELEISTLTASNNYVHKPCTSAEIAEAEKWAKEQIEEEEDMEEEED
ncbi:hypothetical protein TrLO_g7155 [Triparma laevis f. longispina]|uniref:Proteasome subunit alpha type n=1 Tax=Triparma laevis f. longispina TaxID=1714387 RepID=A0A9W7KX12_9STRA|nr:hypothetical protein TrLO_g7155 [Triparma laevis f. longispina]